MAKAYGDHAGGIRHLDQVRASGPAMEVPDSCIAAGTEMPDAFAQVLRVAHPATAGVPLQFDDSRRLMRAKEAYDDRNPEAAPCHRRHPPVAVA
jgi:hypothetical protein